MYRYVDKKSFLNWGLTSDWLVEGPRKRRASAAASGLLGFPVCKQSHGEDKKVGQGGGRPSGEEDAGVGACCAAEDEEDPNAASEGYGEMTEGSIQRLLMFLQTLASNPALAALLPVPPPCTPPISPFKHKQATRSQLSAASFPSTAAAAVSGVASRPHFTPDPCWNLTPSSSFIDVGSGYGKVVLHAKLSAKVARAEGIEYVAARAQMAAAAQEELANGAHAFMTEKARELLRGEGCVLKEGDATKHGTFNFSHVYMYDKVFSDPTIALLAAQLNASPYRVLVSYQRIEVWRRLGLEHVVELDSLTMRTTGGQNFKAYVYINQEAA